MTCGLVTAQFRILIRKHSFERLRQAGGFNSFALGCLDDGRGCGSQKRIARPGHLEGLERQTCGADGLQFSQQPKDGRRFIECV